MPNAKPQEIVPTVLDDRALVALNDVVLGRLEEMRLLPIKQVADILARSERTVVRMIDSGELPHVRVGRGLLVRMADLRSYIEANTYARR